MKQDDSGAAVVDAEPVGGDAPTPRAADRGQPPDHAQTDAPVARRSGSKRPGGSKRTAIVATIVRSAVGIVALGLGLAVFAALAADRPEAEKAPIDEVVRSVRVATAGQHDIARTWEGFGTARALRASDVAAEVAGVVRERPERIEAGVRVEEGELLVALDPGEFQDRVESVRRRIAALEAQLQGLDVEAESVQEQVALAEEAVRLTEDELRRLRESLEQRSAAPVEVDRLERELTITRRDLQRLREAQALIPSRRANLNAQLAAERANLRLAERDLRRTRIVAPFAGRLQSIEADVGERVAPGEVVARLVDLSRVEVPLQLPASAAGSIAVGDEARLRRAGAPGDTDAKEWSGRLVRLAPEADAQTRTVSVFVLVEQSAAALGPDVLLPGEFLMGEVTADRAQPRVVIPRRAIEEDRVMIVDAENRVRVRTVDVLETIEASFPRIDPEENQWAVLSVAPDSGVAPGERVVISGVGSLSAGVLVEPVDASERARDNVGGGDRAGEGSP